jgi:1-acyl-sn-glycerol-3-phosphate acyltransferase
LGLVLNQMLLALLVLAIFTNITALQRIVHVWRLTRERDPAAEFTPSEAEGLRAGRTIPESRYPYPPALVAAITWSVLTGRRRSFAADSARLLAGVKPVPRIENAHLIPAEGSFMVTANHYGRPGFDVWWCAILVSHAIAERRVNESCDIHWLMASEWRVQGLKNLVEQPLTRFLFARLARSYGFISTPPMPPDPGRAAQGMHSVRQALRIAHPSDGERAGLIGVFPEGQDTPHSALMQPLHGVGTFLIMLTRNGLPILPVGLHERDGALVAAFGTPFTLNVPPGLSREERDREACQQVMVAVGKLLPPELWGDYHQEVAEALKEE